MIRRALTIRVAKSGLKKVATFLGFGAIYFLLLYLSDRAAYFFYLHSLPSSLAIDLIVFLPTLTTFGLFIVYRYRTREASLAEDAKMWLAARELEKTQPTAVVKMQRSRLQIWLWAPSVIVLLVAPFVPEEIGMVSHLFVSQTAVLGKYRIQIPVTWIIDDKQEAHLSAMTVPGIGRIGLKTYLRFSPPLTAMYFYPLPHPEEQLAPSVYLKGETILAMQSFALGGETLTCWDLIHNNPFVGPSPSDPSLAEIECTTESDDFFAGFYGWRRDSAVFYETLRKIKTSER